MATLVLVLWQNNSDVRNRACFHIGDSFGDIFHKNHSVDIEQVISVLKNHTDIFTNTTDEISETMTWWEAIRWSTIGELRVEKDGRTQILINWQSRIKFNSNGTYDIVPQTHVWLNPMMNQPNYKWL